MRQVARAHRYDSRVANIKRLNAGTRYSKIAIFFYCTAVIENPKANGLQSLKVFEITSSYLRSVDCLLDDARLAFRRIVFPTFTINDYVDIINLANKITNKLSEIARIG